MKLHSYFNENDDVLLLNTIYVPPLKVDDKFRDPILYLVYRDNKTKEKHMKEIKNPEVTTFITKPEYRNSFKTQRAFMTEDMVDAYNVKYNNLSRFIINKIKEDGKDLEYLKVCEDAPKEAFKWRHSYFADYNICDYAMIAYNLSNNITNTDITKAFLDIEGDVYGLSSTEIDDASYPINAVSIVMPYDQYGNKFKHPKVFTFLLRNHIRYKQQEYFENHLDKFIEECHEEFDDKYNKPQFIIRIFDDEVTMLKSLFAVLHKLSPDFIEIWNMGYDVPTISKRLINLGEDPFNYFCHPDFQTQLCRYNYDVIYKNDFKNKCESFDCTSYSMWIDQMLNYAGIRKSKNDYGGNSLDNIAKIELNAEKRRYSKKTVTVLNGAIEEYWNFVKYSINDVLLQYGIDNKTDDTQAIFEQSLYGGTRLSKTLKQSVYLKNVFAIEYFSEFNIVPHNNTNVNYTQYKNEENAIDADVFKNKMDYDDITLPGAVVGDPTKNEHTGVYILGERSNALFNDVMDEDFEALYPNTKLVSNIAEHTQYGRVIVQKQILEDENLDNNPKFIRGGKLIDDYETDDCSMSARWIGLKPTYDYIKEYSKERL